MLRMKRTKCNCKECPLAGENKVYGLSDIDKPSIVIIGEAPGEREALKGIPFVGSSGEVLQQAVKSAGLMWHTLYKTNVILCRPPGNDIDSPEGKKAIECCREGFLEELEALVKEYKVKVLVPVGATALKAVGIEGRITKQRGSVSMVMGLPAVPTYHPSYIMRGNWNEEVTWVNDLMKARELTLKKWKPPKEMFNLFPSLKDVKDFVSNALKNDMLVAVDLETTNLNPYWSEILMVGLATSGEDALVVPFTTLTPEGVKRYWSDAEEQEVYKQLRKLMAEGRTMFQNATFDTWHLKRHGMPVKRLTHDTMLIHHAINPELPHNLGYIVSVYGQTPMWKEVVLGSETKMRNMDDKTIRTYNARDTVVLHQILPGLLKDLKDMGTEKTYYEYSLPLVEVVVGMSDYGLLIDKMRMSKKKAELQKQVDKAMKTLKKVAQLPEAFNINSANQMRQLLFGIPMFEQRVLDLELKEYEDNPKKRRDTKKYQDLMEKVKLIKEVQTFGLKKDIVHKTESGLPALDDEALLQVQRHCINRLDALEGIVRRRKEHTEEEQRLRRLLEFIEALYEYRDAFKTLTTFTSFPVANDGRLHPSYKISGTATGRLSSSDPNIQNVPGVVQDVFIAPPNKVLLKADYSNIELRVLAYLADEKILMGAFERGDNIHDLNTKLLFGIDKSHPQWKDIRRAAKVFVFGRSYGGTVEGIYKRLLSEVPQVQLPYAYFVQCDKKYFDQLSSYKSWREKIQKDARETRVSCTAFGRKRILLGLPDEIERQALNTPIQGTAGEICEKSLITMYHEFKKYPEWDAHCITTVHDSIIVECNENKKMEVAKMMKKIMEAPVKLGKYTVSIPVDIGLGYSWAETDTDDAKLKF